jgi:two-component system chemotaxis response regulator CheB
VPQRDIIVVGTSAGGIEALQDLVREFPPSLDAAVLVVMHLPQWRESALPQILSRAGPLPAVSARDGEEVRHGTIYVAPAGYHLLLSDGRVRLGQGPKENRSRPSVDVLFRSAAVACGPRVIGVVLTGLLGDGTAGMFAIKRRGGLAVIQDPSDAAFPSMPLNVLRATDVDFTGSVSEIGRFIVDCVQDRADVTSDGAKSDREGAHAVKERAQLETEVAAGEDVGREAVSDSPPSVFSCPDCGGVLWQMANGDIERFRCRTGHAYSEDGLYFSQEDALESALWAAVRSLSEHAELADRVARRARRKYDGATAEHLEQRRDNLRRAIDVIRGTLMGRDGGGGQSEPAGRAVPVAGAGHAS